MNVLVVSASKHGATEEIGAGIVLELRERGLAAEARPMSEIGTLEGYDAVILGSAIYAGHWMKDALAFIADHEADLRKRPVWLFSSGPIGEMKGHEPIPASTVDKLIAQTGATEHRIFAGKLDPEDLNFAERAITKVVRSPSGDYRDWTDIHAWAAGIAEQLRSATVT